MITTKMGIDATASLLKPKVNFERIRIPGEDKIKLEDYVDEKKSNQRISKGTG